MQNDSNLENINDIFISETLQIYDSTSITNEDNNLYSSYKNLNNEYLITLRKALDNDDVESLNYIFKCKPSWILYLYYLLRNTKYKNLLITYANTHKDLFQGNITYSDYYYNTNTNTYKSHPVNKYKIFINFMIEHLEYNFDHLCHMNNIENFKHLMNQTNFNKYFELPIQPLDKLKYYIYNAELLKYVYESYIKDSRYLNYDTNDGNILFIINKCRQNKNILIPFLIENEVNLNCLINGNNNSYDNLKIDPEIYDFFGNMWGTKNLKNFVDNMNLNRSDEYYTIDEKSIELILDQNIDQHLLISLWVHLVYDANTIDLKNKIYNRIDNFDSLEYDNVLLELLNDNDLNLMYFNLIFDKLSNTNNFPIDEVYNINSIQKCCNAHNAHKLKKCLENFISYNDVYEYIPNILNLMLEYKIYYNQTELNTFKCKCLDVKIIEYIESNLYI